MINYQIVIKANAGTVVVFTEGDLPDGEHVITGHDDGDLVTLHAERKSELGRNIIIAQSVVQPDRSGPRAVSQHDPDQ